MGTDVTQAVKIENLTDDDRGFVGQAADLLVREFAEHWPNFVPDVASATNVVNEALSGDRICRAAVSKAGDRLLGWIAGTPLYDGNVWELHPIVVDGTLQRQGIGAALVEDLSSLTHAKGGVTLMVFTDDEDSMTTLADIDLYDDPLGRLARIRNLKGHPYEFYERMGFAITGVLPDANGAGKPDILMAKRLTDG